MTKELIVVTENNCHLTFGTVDENLDTHEDYLGFYEVHNIKSNTTVIAIILRFNL